MDENIPGHLWDPNTQIDPLATENLKQTGQHINRADPALTESLQALTSLAGELGNITDPDEDTVCKAIRLGRARHTRKAVSGTHEQTRGRQPASTTRLEGLRPLRSPVQPG
ncbi:hypothetical protein [Streptomyces sp. NPDC056707]|uniref:hypothetical protein n=1 Tax=Streptomyces sp. NPDC056707 TaxID=3345919 RepID=UPI0036C34F35